MLSGTIQNRASQVCRTWWVVWRRSFERVIPPCSAIERSRLITRHDVIHGPSHSSGYSHQRPMAMAAAISGSCMTRDAQRDRAGVLAL